MGFYEFGRSLGSRPELGFFTFTMFTRRLQGKRFLVACLHTSRRVQNSRKVIEKFKLADIGEGITECEIIKWLGRRLPQRTDTENTHRNVKPQAVIQAFDPLCEVQSDKASVVSAFFLILNPL